MNTFRFVSRTGLMLLGYVAFPAFADIGSKPPATINIPAESIVVVGTPALQTTLDNANGSPVCMRVVDYEIEEGNERAMYLYSCDALDQGHLRDDQALRFRPLAVQKQILGSDGQPVTVTMLVPFATFGSQEQRIGESLNKLPGETGYTMDSLCTGPAAQVCDIHFFEKRPRISKR